MVVVVGRRHSSERWVEERKGVEVLMGADGTLFELPQLEAEGRRYQWKGCAVVTFVH